MYSLDHPSGTGEALQDRVIPSTRRTEPRTWGSLDTRSFAQSVRAVHHLVLAAGDHTYQAVLATDSGPPNLGRHNSGGTGRPSAGIVKPGDIRHAAISLSFALLDDALHDGLHVQDEPIASLYTLDGPAPTWGQLPPRMRDTALAQITACVSRTRRTIWTAVDAALISQRSGQSASAAPDLTKVNKTASATSPMVPPHLRNRPAGRSRLH
ncbi:hypothetical protein H1D24_32050 [Streptomyces sp. PSKA28]|uniref:Uncharacterized protein n=1 Tax=Streptomyces himalayensis subsp. himalayensis TaxID=2756131 RepID=A0A7W0ICD5_9ACTN|nr:hypothetical protein [Streptomyces himalayensis subsp. himalayensis]